MQKGKYIYLALLLGLLMVLFAIGYSYLKHQELLTQRHHLLCEVLKPGMSEDEVLAVLKQAGEFTMSKGEWTGGNITLSISFTNATVKERYGYFSVVFFDYKYARAVVSHGETPEYICDFYRVTQSITETPKP